MQPAGGVLHRSQCRLKSAEGITSLLLRMADSRGPSGPQQAGYTQNESAGANRCDVLGDARLLTDEFDDLTIIDDTGHAFASSRYACRGVAATLPKNVSYEGPRDPALAQDRAGLSLAKTGVTERRLLPHIHP